MGFSNDPGQKVAKGPLLPLIALGFALNEIATSDVPMIGGTIAKAGARATERVAEVAS